MKVYFFCVFECDNRLKLKTELKKIGTAYGLMNINSAH